VKLREPFVYFVDRSLGRRVVVEALLAAGELAHAHDDHFAIDAPDSVWLAEVARRGWVVLTKDKNIRRNEVERAALVTSGAACFMLGRGDLSGAAMGRVLIEALPRVRRVLRRYEPPLAASVNLWGHLRLLMESGRLIEPPRDIR
jgi:predicted nuclease of predicted toxin-antitoxin system